MLSSKKMKVFKVINTKKCFVFVQRYVSETFKDERGNSILFKKNSWFFLLLIDVESDCALQHSTTIWELNIVFLFLFELNLKL